MNSLRWIFALAFCKLSLIAAGDVGEPPAEEDKPLYEMDSCACEMPGRNYTERLCSPDINFFTHLKLVGNGNPRCHDPVNVEVSDDRCMSVVYTFESTKVGGVTIDISTPRDSPECEIVPEYGVKYSISGKQFQKDIVTCNEIQSGDVVFIVDASGSIGGNTFRNVVVPFLIRLKNSLIAVSNSVNFAAITFNQNAVVRFPIVRGRSSSLLTTLLNNLRSVYNGGATAIGRALRLAANSVLVPPFVDDIYPNICIVLTDGNNNRGISVATGAAELKPKCETIFAIGVGSERDISQTTLDTIASDPDKAIRVRNFNELTQSLVDTITKSICTPTGETKKVCNVKRCLGIFKETDHEEFHDLKQIYDHCSIQNGSHED